MTVKIKDVTSGYIKEIEALKAERDALAKEVDAANDRIGELTEERGALSVMTECLKQHMSRFHEIDGAFSAAQWQNTANALVKLTPQQCLRDVKAETGRAGFIVGCHCGAKYNIHDWDNQADEYAATVRQGGK